MVHPAATDIIRLVRQIVTMLHDFANSHKISLTFDTKEKKLVVDFRPDHVIHDLTNLICQVISYTPSGNSITVDLTLDAERLNVRVLNTGVNLSQVVEIVRSCKQQIIVSGDNEKKQTSFQWSLLLPASKEEKSKNHKPVDAINKMLIPEYYDEIRKRLRSHFSKADTLVAQLSILYPKEADFLQKVNAVIIANLENESFDSSSLSREMHMSRAGLFRRLKPLIRQAPAAYIKSIRLQKAKELLETEDITVGEAAFKTGFQTQSHFTKAFTEAFGFRPSTIRRKNQSATNE
jgi:AraC-like DNA-binding protein